MPGVCPASGRLGQRLHARSGGPLPARALGAFHGAELRFHLGAEVGLRPRGLDMLTMLADRDRRARMLECLGETGEDPARAMGWVILSMRTQGPLRETLR